MSSSAEPDDQGTTGQRAGENISVRCQISGSQEVSREYLENHKAFRMRTAKEIPDEVFSSNCDTLTDCDAVIEVADISAHGPLSTTPGRQLSCW